VRFELKTIPDQHSPTNGLSPLPEWSSGTVAAAETGSRLDTRPSRRPTLNLANLASPRLSRQLNPSARPIPMSMNMLTKWNPFNMSPGWEPFPELEEMQNRIASFMGRRLPLLKGGGEGEEFALTTWAPRVDIVEDDKEYVINAELPGVKKEEVKVSVENGVLSFSGERKTEKEEKEKKFHRIEQTYGTFTRSFTLRRAVPAKRSVRIFGTAS